MIHNEKINELLSLINNLNKELDSINTKIYCLSKSKKILNSRNLHSIELNNLLDEFIEKKNSIIENIQNNKKSISEIRKKCNHNWLEIGHDSHHTYYKCNICGDEESY